MAERAGDWLYAADRSHFIAEWQAADEMQKTSPITVRLFWAGVVFTSLATVVGTQLVGIYCWDDPPISPMDRKTASLVLGTSKILNPEWLAPTGTSMTSEWDDRSFLRYLTIVLWLAVLLSGLGMEYVFGEPLVVAASAKKREVLPGTDTTLMVVLWKVAQLWFSLCVAIALLSQSFFGLPFGVIGLWKCGFPETFGCFRSALSQLQGDREFNFRKFVVGFINGLGTILHHSSAAYLICCIDTRLVPLDRRVLSLATPLLAQHLFVLLKYWNRLVYAAIEAFLEVGFQMEVFAYIDGFSTEGGYDLSIRGCLLMMVLAHYLYWLAAVLAIPDAFPGMFGGEAGNEEVLEEDTARKWAQQIQTTKIQTNPSNDPGKRMSKNPAPENV